MQLPASSGLCVRADRWRMSFIVLRDEISITKGKWQRLDILAGEWLFLEMTGKINFLCMLLHGECMDICMDFDAV